MKPDVIESLQGGLYPTESVHVRAIEAHFGEQLLRELNAEERGWLGSLDLFFVVFTNRSGSTYLTELLHQMGAGIHPRAEIFNQAAVIRISTERGYATFTDYLLDRLRPYSRGGRAGFKIGIHQLFWFTQLGLLSPFKSLRFINSLRTDPLDQAVSYVKAQASGEWHTLMEGRGGEDDGPPEYARADIARILLRVTTQRQLFDYYCALHRPRVLSVVYEELLANRGAQLEALARFLEVPDFDPGSVDDASIGIAQQRDETNARLKATFIEEFSLD